MNDRFNCPNCQHDLLVDAKLRGELIQCPSCKETIMVPEKLEFATEDAQAKHLGLLLRESGEQTKLLKKMAADIHGGYQVLVFWFVLFILTLIGIVIAALLH
jgi:hypothetical protein